MSNPSAWKALGYLMVVLISSTAFAQTSLPSEARLENGMLTRGDQPVTGLYAIDQVNKIEITLTESNWFALLDGTNGPNGQPGESLIGSVTFNDTLAFDSVVVSIKGQTSDFRNNSEKKSFKLEFDEYINQDLLGYDNLNLNGGYEDPSGMREVLYYDIARGFTHALKGAFIDLYINGQYWGPYHNIQQIEGTYIKEWFSNNQGTRWRADEPDDSSAGGGGGGPGGGRDPFNTGFATLNYNGPDSSDYTPYYTLKNSTSEDPWQVLIDYCQELNSLAVEDMYTGLSSIMDIDRTLWMLAQEAVVADDDSYINKGGMDYYVYFDDATQRLMTLEVDGNSVMTNNHLNWSIFYNENDDRFPLLYRMLQNTEIRQRYLAHVRYILANHFEPSIVNPRIDYLASLIEDKVQNDPKALYDFAEWLSGVDDLKMFIEDRADLLNSDSEIDRTGVTLSNLEATFAGGTSAQPEESVQIKITTGGDAQTVLLYYGTGLDGQFERTEMFDDGQHNDGSAQDGIFGAEIPGFSGGNYVRYYVEAIKADAHQTASYFPAGAEHDVFIYQVAFPTASADEVVINELMADNETVVSDPSGAYEDWVELYNPGTADVDLAGHYLTDDESRPDKWQFPANAIVPADGYLTVWLDEDGSQTTATSLHANFKLSKDGELIKLVAPDLSVIDETSFGPLSEDLSWARSPNGTGDFQEKNPSFGYNNDQASSTLEPIASNFSFYPNPAREELNFTNTDQVATVSIYDVFGRLVLTHNSFGTPLNLSRLSAGTYFLQADIKGSGYGQAKTGYSLPPQKLIVQH